MLNVRQPLQVAQRAIILGAISFRASLEVTDHPRVAELSQKLLPWLHSLGIDDELDPIERALLETPIGELSASQQMDANWASESCSLFCWALTLTDAPDVAVPVDGRRLLELLKILNPDVVSILQAATLRNVGELEATCKQCVLVRSALQEARVAPAVAEIIRRSNRQRLADVGITATEVDLQNAATTVAAMTPDERRRAAGIYMVRDHAALWLFSSRPSYFSTSDQSLNKDQIQA